MRSDIPFPMEDNSDFCRFLNDAWINGWLNEYSDEHFLIKAIGGVEKPPFINKLHLLFGVPIL